MSNVMLDFLASLKANNQQLSEVIDTIQHVYSLTSMPKINIDYSYLRYPPGHYACPVPSVDEINSISESYFDFKNQKLPGIDLREEFQINLYREFVEYYSEFPYCNDKLTDLRFSAPNSWFGLGDAFILFSMIKKFQPKRIIEIGSGFSSCVMLDVNQHVMNRTMQLHFVEPYPENRLLHLVREEDYSSCSIIKSFVQQIVPTKFTLLEENDILFIDSSHVAKVGSDVLYILNHILPALNKGVLVHFHDIPFPFEFSRDAYLQGGEPWNEMYLLRAFLQFNSSFEVMLFGDFINNVDSDVIQIPNRSNLGSGSLWIRKTV